MVDVGLQAVYKLYHASDVPSDRAGRLIEAALVCLALRQPIFAVWLVLLEPPTSSSFPLIVDRVHDLLCRINSRLTRLSSHTHFRGLPEMEVHAILTNYPYYLATQL